MRYVCNRPCKYGKATCQSLAGPILDTYVTQLVLEAIQPAALEASFKVAEDWENEKKQLQKHWAQRLERAHYQAERAQRQYSAVEPENRLVSRTLEKQWEESLEIEEQLKRENQQFLAQQPASLTIEQQKAIHRLVEDLPQLWNALTTTPKDRQEIVRQLVEKVSVEVEGQSEKVRVQVFWIGGHQTSGTLIRPVHSTEQLSYYPQLLSRVAQLYSEHQSPTLIAQTLNKEGWRTTRYHPTFTSTLIRTLLARQGLWVSPRKSPSDRIKKQANEWTKSELSIYLQIPTTTLYAWLLNGKIKGRLDRTLKQRPIWLIFADKKELERIRKLHQAPRIWKRPIRIGDAAKKS